MDQYGNSDHANTEDLHPAIAIYSMTKPFSVKIFLADGEPAGIKVVERSN